MPNRVLTMRLAQILSLNDVNELRVESAAIDRAVRKAAIDALERQPSLLTDTRRIRRVFDKLDTDESGESGRGRCCHSARLLSDWHW